MPGLHARACVWSTLWPEFKPVRHGPWSAGPGQLGLVSWAWSAGPGQLGWAAGLGFCTVAMGNRTMMFGETQHKLCVVFSRERQQCIIVVC